MLKRVSGVGQERKVLDHNVVTSRGVQAARNFPLTSVAGESSPIRKGTNAALPSVAKANKRGATNRALGLF